jgi:ureidoacrylate peracid hydrolase
VIDMQKDFTTRGFFWDKIGQDMSSAEALVERLARFVDVAREHDVLVVHVMANYDPQFMTDPMYERLHRHGAGLYCQSGTPGIEFHESLEPRDGEPVVVKHRFDAFYGTDLGIILQARGIKTVITTGLVVHGCVDSTARHAYFDGYYLVFPSDLSGGVRPEVHAMELELMSMGFGVTPTADEVVAAWQQAGKLRDRKLVGAADSS